MTVDDIVIVGQLPPPTHGSTIMTARLRDTLTALQLPVEVVERRFSSTIDEVGRPTVMKIARIPALWFRVARATRQASTVTILFVTDRPGSFLIDVVSTAIASRGGRQVIHYVHTQGFRRLAARGSFWRNLVRRVLGAGSRVVSLSPALSEDVAPFTHANRIRIIPNTVGDSTPLKKPMSDTAVLLFVGNLFRSKQPHILVDVVEALIAHGIAASAVIAGADADGPYSEELRERIRASSVGDRIALVGQVDPDQRRELFRTSTVLVHPTTDDAQPLIILEALAAGLPVIGSTVGGIPDLLGDSIFGEVVSTGDVDGFIAAVMRSIEHGDREREVERAARYDEVYGTRAYAERWMSLLDEFDRPKGAAKGES